MRNEIKFIHTSDFHLGAAFVGWGEAAQPQRRRLLDTLHDIVDLAINEGASFILFAGDTFASNWPAPSTMQTVKQEFKRLAEKNIACFLIGGEKDAYMLGGALQQLAAALPETVTVFQPGLPSATLLDESVKIWGVSVLPGEQTGHPLAGIRRDQKQQWQIGMVHAALDAGLDMSDVPVLRSDDISETRMDYLAFGHRLHKAEVSEGGVVAWYSGAPEMVTWHDREPGSVMLVTLKRNAAPLVWAYTVGRAQVLKFQADTGELPKLLKKIGADHDKNQMFDLTITGTISPQEKVRLQGQLAELAKTFVVCKIKDRSLLEMTYEDLERYSDQTVI
jgi:DNA repair exonuclease SbcCD nuclease subunit